MDERLLLTAACFVIFSCLELSAVAFVDAVRLATELVPLSTDPACLFLLLHCCFLGGEVVVRRFDESSLLVIVLVLLMLATGLEELERCLLFVVGGADGICGVILLVSTPFSLTMTVLELDRGLLIVMEGVGGFYRVLLE